MCNVKQLATCPKCDGRGSIQAFANVAGGVCFTCGGKGVFDVAAERQRTMTPEVIRRCEFILNATAEQVASLNFCQLEIARWFAKLPHPLYPTIHDAWAERFESAWKSAVNWFYASTTETEQAEWYNLEYATEAEKRAWFAKLNLKK